MNKTKTASVSSTSCLVAFFIMLSLHTAGLEIVLCSAVATTYVDPTTITVGGKTFTIDIRISDVVDLYGWEFRLGWNSTLLDVISVSEGPFLRQGGETFFANKTNNISGYILADCTLFGNVPGVSGDGTLVTIEFRVEGEGESVLDLYDTTLVSSIEMPIIHQSTDGCGYFTSALVGDVNGDGVVDIFDAVTVAIAFGSKLGDPHWNADADLNNDETIDIYDVVILAIHFGEELI